MSCFEPRPPAHRRARVVDPIGRGLSLAPTSVTRADLRVIGLSVTPFIGVLVMRKIIALVVLGTGLVGCALPFTTSKDERKAPCDRLAAQAIQTNSLADAKSLSAQAAECYAKAQGE